MSATRRKPVLPPAIKTVNVELSKPGNETSRDGQAATPGGGPLLRQRVSDRATCTTGESAPVGPPTLRPPCPVLRRARTYART